MSHQGFGFCEFFSEEDAEYACRIMNGIKLFGKPIRVNKVCRSAHFGNAKKTLNLAYMSHTYRRHLTRSKSTLVLISSSEILTSTSTRQRCTTPSSTSETSSSLSRSSVMRQAIQKVLALSSTTPLRLQIKLSKA